MISFKPLQKFLIQAEISKTEFTKMMKFSTSTTAKMWRNEYIAMKLIDDICKKLNCTITDVIEFVPDKEQ